MGLAGDLLQAAKDAKEKVGHGGRLAMQRFEMGIPNGLKESEAWEKVGLSFG